jgi:hypothetical protein
VLEKLRFCGQVPKVGSVCIGPLRRCSGVGVKFIFSKMLFKANVGFGLSGSWLGVLRKVGYVGWVMSVNRRNEGNG